LTKLAPSEARGGGEVMDKIGRGVHLPRPKIVFLFLGYVLETAGRLSIKEKKEADSKTEIPI